MLVLKTYFPQAQSAQVHVSPHLHPAGRVFSVVPTLGQVQLSPHLHEAPQAQSQTFV
jgi:hypothetical protein